MRINEKAADSIQKTWPDKTVYVITINWLQGHPHFNDEEKAHIIDLSKRVDCFFDQGHTGYQIDPAQRRPSIKQMHCAYSTSGKLWLYSDTRWYRGSNFLPYVRRAVKGLKSQYEDRVRGCLYYPGATQQRRDGGPVVRTRTKSFQSAKGPEAVLGEAIELYYKP